VENAIPSAGIKILSVYVRGIVCLLVYTFNNGGCMTEKIKTRNTIKNSKKVREELRKALKSRTLTKEKADEFLKGEKD